MQKLVISYLLFAVFFVFNTPGWSEQNQEQEVIELLSSAGHKESLTDTVHENEHVLKAMGLFLQTLTTKRMNEEEMTSFFHKLCVRAGWSEWVPAVIIKRAGDQLYYVSIGALASTQPSSLYLFYDRGYQKIITGENGLISVTDFRIQGEEAGVVFCRNNSTHPRLDFTLLRRSNNGWEVVWTSAGQVEWISTDGQVKFLKDDLSSIEVKGSSFDLQPGVEEMFMGSPRNFTGIWEKKNRGYIRKTTLSSNASFYDELWEMTEPSPAATVFEFLRRLRLGMNSDASNLSDITIVKKAEALGLSETTDSNGEIIYYEWGSALSAEGEKKIPAKYISEGVVISLNRREPLQQFIAILTPSKTVSDKNTWKIIDIEKIF